MTNATNQGNPSRPPSHYRWLAVRLDVFQLVEVHSAADGYEERYRATIYKTDNSSESDEGKTEWGVIFRDGAEVCDDHSGYPSLEEAVCRVRALLGGINAELTPALG
jgi:hypothetical protein